MHALFSTIVVPDGAGLSRLQPDSDPLEKHARAVLGANQPLKQ